MKKYFKSALLLGALATCLTTQAQVTIPGTFAAPPGAVDTTKNGFRARFVHATATANNSILGNVNAAENLLAGLLIDPATGAPYSNDLDRFEDYYPVDPTGNSTFILPVINNNNGTVPWYTPPFTNNNGAVSTDMPIPGIPGISFPAQTSSNNIAAEITGYLHLTAGQHTLGFSSDDGYRMTVGVGTNVKDIFAKQIGIFDAGRGASTTPDSMVMDVLETGYYPFRLVWFQGNGGGSLELTEFVDNSWQLVNGDNNAAKVYYAATAAVRPYGVAVNPAQNSVNQQQLPLIYCDVGGGVDNSKFAMNLNGTSVPVTVSSVNGNTRAEYQVTTPLVPGSQNTVDIVYGNTSFTITNSWSFTVGTVVTIPPEYAVPGTPGPAGFTIAVHQADAVNAAGVATDLLNTRERAETQVRGYLIDPTTSQPYQNVATVSSTTSSSYINWNVYIGGDPNAGHVGNFQGNNGYPDQAVPGIPGNVVINQNTDNIAVATMAYLDLPAGPLTLGVNSDDGFVVTTGLNPADMNAMVLGIFEGGRGSSDSLFNVVVQQAGIYPVRLLWYQGGGGGNLEFFSVKSDGTKLPVNDVTTGAVKAYQSVSGAISYATIDQLLPYPNSIGNAKTSVVSVKLRDGAGAAVNQGTIVLTMNGATVAATPSSSGGVTTVTYDPPGDLPVGATITNTIAFSDSATPAKNYFVEWTWDVGGEITIKKFGGDNAGQAITGGGVNNLWGAAAFIDNAPTTNYIAGLLEMPSGADNNYGTEVLGYVVVKETGDYRFYLSSDDNSDLWLSSDDKAANLRRIAFQASSNGYRAYTSGNNVAPRQSAVVSLVAGERYMIWVLHKEGTGGDHLSVALRKASQAIVNNDTPMSGELRPFQGIDFRFAPVGGTIPVNGYIRMSAQSIVGVSGQVTSVWLKNGQPIAGTENTQYNRVTHYTIDGALPEDAGDYSVRVSVAGGPTVESPVATVQVVNDTTPPALVSAGMMPGATAVGVRFSEIVTAASVNDPSNFTVSGVTVTGAQATGGGTNNSTVVQLTVSAAPAAGFTVTARNIRDINNNTLGSATVTGEVSDVMAQDLFRNTDPAALDPILPGNTVYCGTGTFIIRGGGSDIWNNQDAGQFAYTQVTGPFDIRVRAEFLEGPDTWTKACLMVRESLAGGSRRNDILITRTGGQNLYNVQWRESTDGGSGSLTNPNRLFAATYPSWMRLVRSSTANNTIDAYLSLDDGANWIPYTQFTVQGAVLPETVYVGVAVTSHNNGDTQPLAEAVVSDFTVIPLTGPVDDPEITVFDVTPTTVTIEWTNGGTLQSKDNLNDATWTDRDSDGSYEGPVEGTSRFFRVMRAQ